MVIKMDSAEQATGNPGTLPKFYLNTESSGTLFTGANR
jgi:hypothetical protein